jgi:hypothetical protein
MAPLKIGKQATSAYDRLAQGMEELADQAEAKKSSSAKSAKTQAGGSFVVSGTVDGEGVEDTFGSKSEALKYIQTLLKSASDYDVELSSGDKVIETYSSSPQEEEGVAGDRSLLSKKAAPEAAPADEEEEGVAGDRSLIREKERLGLMTDPIPRYGGEEGSESEQEKLAETLSKQKKVVAKVVRKKKN